MPSINRRHFIAGAIATGAYLTTHSWSAVSSLAQTATKTFSGNVIIPEGFTVPAGETWEFDPLVSTTVVVEKNVVVHGTLRMRPSAASVVHTLRFENVDESAFVGGGMEVLSSDVGLWVMGFGRLDLHGTAKRAWNRTGWDPSWAAGDEVRIAPSAKGDTGTNGFERFVQGDTVPGIDVPGMTVRSFVDTSSSPFAADIEAIYAAGITTGYGDGRFGPNDGVTRGQMAAFLVRALGLGSAGSAGFTDVVAHWAEDSINRLAAAGITTGYGDGRFGPNDGVTRGQMAAFLVRALGLGSAGSAGFTDVVGHWAEDSINRLAAAGITTGYGDGRFGPNDGVTRGQMAAFLRRALNLSVPEAQTRTSLSTEILNLSRNVRITGTPEGRSHVIIHSSVPQTISNVEIRHVGPRDSSGEEGVLGRYGLHFHHCGEGSRGSILESVVVTQCGNHAFVPHLSHGITFRDCISYDTVEDAFWWDEGDPTNDLVWERCVAAYVRSEPDFRGFRLAGFVLGKGTNVTAIACVATGVQGNEQASGFHWPELPSGTEGVWTFADCVAHNNRRNGIFTWQNTSLHHRVDRFVGYNNGHAGIEHGAYVNAYHYLDSVLLSGEIGLLVHANSKADLPIVFSNIYIEGMNSAVTLVGSNGTPNQPTVFDGIQFAENQVKVTVAGETDLEQARNDLFRNCAIDPGEVRFSSAKAGSVFVFERPDGSRWSMDDSGAVSP